MPDVFQSVSSGEGFARQLVDMEESACSLVLSALSYSRPGNGLYYIPCGLLDPHKGAVFSFVWGDAACPLLPNRLG